MGECEDVEIPQQKIEVANTCKTVTVQRCGLEPTETEAADEAAVEAERRKREAEADPQVLLHTPYLAAPVVPLLKHVCEDVSRSTATPRARSWIPPSPSRSVCGRPPWSARMWSTRSLRSSVRLWPLSPLPSLRSFKSSKSFCQKTDCGGTLSCHQNKRMNSIDL